MSDANAITESLIPLKAIIFDLPEVEQLRVKERKAAILLAAGGDLHGLLGMSLAFGELAVYLENLEKEGRK